MVLWYMFTRFGMLSKKNLATLLSASPWTIEGRINISCCFRRKGFFFQ
jgi:hypothetical protein